MPHISSPRLPAFFAVLMAAFTLNTTAHAQTFSNAAPIAIPFGGTATPYPSPIDVSGVTAPIGYLSVTLNGFTHSWVGDVNVLLVSPTGQKILLMANTNGNDTSRGTASSNTLTFIPDGATTLPSGATAVVSGVYACSVYSAPSALPAPAPAGPYATSLAPLIGTNPNGTWNLYVLDDNSLGDSGSISGGWSIGFSSTAPGPVATAFTYQGLLSAGGTPINGNANVRFTLSNSDTVPTTISAVALPITRSFSAVTGGRITTTLDFGTAIDANQARWLNIEVESPPGSGFVTLTPRQPITPAPQARIAQRAVLADTADTATQLAAGRARIRGDVGPSGSSPGIFFASPINAPVDRSFVGQRDDTNVGFFSGSWNFLVNSNGNTVLGDATGNAPPERLTVNGSIQINTGTNVAPNRLAFGPIGNLTNTAESTDAVFFQRVVGTSNNTDFRLYVGDDPGVAPGAGGDTFSIWSTGAAATSGTENFRFQMNGVALKPGGGSWGVLSDPRAKHDIAPLAGTLDKLLNLRGYSFLYNDDRIASGLARPGTQIGLMADEVARVFPDWISTDASGTRYVTERATTALMVEALRDLRAEKDAVAAKAETAQKQIDDLKADAAKRDAENTDLKARLAAIEAAMLKMNTNNTTSNTTTSKGDK